MTNHTPHAVKAQEPQPESQRLAEAFRIFNQASEELSTAYTSLQEAYDAAANNDIIQAQAVDLTGNLTVNRNISVTLEGGYGCDFGAFAGINTILNGWIKTTSGGGTLTIKNFELE